MCEKNTSLLNGIGFLLLIAASLMCTLSFSSPFWVYYPTKYGVPDVKEKYDLINPKYPFKMASWRGLWAVCFKEPNIQGSSSVTPVCAWFWEKEFSIWKTIPSKYVSTVASLSCCHPVR